MTTHHLEGPSAAAACPYLSAVVARVADAHRRAGELRRECAALLEAHVMGAATPDMRRRHTRLRIALALHESPPLPAWPGGAAELLRANQQWVLESIVGPLGVEEDSAPFEDVHRAEGDSTPVT